MEMHPLAASPHSFKDLAIHIGIVTVGILIALSLEGIRETIHDHHLVRDARESFRVEIEPDLKHMDPELAGADRASKAAHAVLLDLPALEKDPTQLKQRVDDLFTGGYTFSSNSWQAALSSGALAHMSAKEVRRYSDFDYDVRWYTSIEDRAWTAEIDLHSYVDSRRAFGPHEMEEVEYRLRSFVRLTEALSYVGNGVREDMKAALSAQ